MKIDDIMSLWEQDAQIDNTELAKESLNIPLLHHKYFKILTQESILLKKLEYDYKTLYRLKYEYFMGTLDRETMIEKGWEPNQLKILKQDLSIFIESDLDIQECTKKIDIQREKINFLESVIKNLNNRGFLIKNAIDWHKFQVGG